jgi:hypothetical protein
MSTAIFDALTAVADTAAADFDTRDTAATIRPVSRSVRRYRATAGLAAALGASTAVAAVVWGAQSLSMPQPPATTPQSTTRPTPPTSDAQDYTPWNTIALAILTEPRKYGERRIDAAAGMICHHADPLDDPRVAIQGQSDPLGPEITELASCVPVWFQSGPITSDRNATATITLASGEEPAAISSGAIIGNLSALPIAIDGDSIFMWIETDPGSPGAPMPAAYSHTLIGKSMWEPGGNTTALLGSTALSTRIIPGQYLVASAIATEAEGEGPLADLIASGANFTVSFWARIHDEDAPGGPTYIIRLGEEHTYGGVEE